MCGFEGTREDVLNHLEIHVDKFTIEPQTRYKLEWEGKETITNDEESAKRWFEENPCKNKSLVTFYPYRCPTCKCYTLLDPHLIVLTCSDCYFSGRESGCRYGSIHPNSKVCEEFKEI